MVIGTLGRYFGLRFFGTVVAVFAGVLTLIILVDYIEMMRRYSELTNVSALTLAKTSLFRVPQATERILPFCVLTGAMSCYLNLSRRLELVVARAAGVSAWQFISPALVVALLLGAFTTMVYNPVAALMLERSKRLEAEFTGTLPALTSAFGFWVRQRNADSQSIIYAGSSREQGGQLSNILAFTFDVQGRFTARIEARSATLGTGAWRLEDARIFKIDQPPIEAPLYEIKTSLTPEQVRERFATPETVPFWQLPLYIEIANHAGLVASGYRLQFQKLLARPFLFAAMVLLAAAFSLRLFRFGGVQKMVLGGMSSGFALFVISKITDDLGNSDVMNPMLAAWLPALLGGFTGFIALLHLEDG
jgi:lipopolysaccharide export system permease protein